MPSPQKVKGKSFENAKAKFLTEIFGEKFIRVPTSGAFLGGQNYDRRHSMSQGQVMAFKGCLLYTSPSPRDQRGSGIAACA